MHPLTKEYGAELRNTVHPTWYNRIDFEKRKESPFISLLHLFSVYKNQNGPRNRNCTFPFNFVFFSYTQLLYSLQGLGRDYNKALSGFCLLFLRCTIKVNDSGTLLVRLPKGIITFQYIYNAIPLYLLNALLS